MKNIFILLFCVSAIQCSLYAQDKECLDQIRTGTFTYTVENYTVVTIERTETKQIESYNNGRSKIFTKIKWISRNEYMVTFLRQKNARGCLKRGDVMKVTIIECDGWNYTAHITSELCGNSDITIKRIK